MAPKPTTSTERSKKRRKLIRECEELHEQEKEKERLRWKKRAEQTKNKVVTPSLIEAKRLKERKRKAKWRESKKQMLQQQAPEQSELSHESPYSTKQSLAKASKKVVKALPKTTPKKIAVISHVIGKMSPQKRKLLFQRDSILKRRLFTEERKERSDALSGDTKTLVCDFYNRDDVSCLRPGKNDYVKVGKNTVQKRVLITNLSETHSFFKEEHPAVKVGLSTFKSLRPTHVKSFMHQKQQVCCCPYHENLELLIEQLNKENVFVNKMTVKEVNNSTICSGTELKCVSRDCDLCGVNKVDSHFDEDVDNFKEIVYLQWTGSRTEKTCVTKTIGEAKDELKLQLHSFALHVYNNSRQHAELRLLKENLLSTEIIVQIDFAENYSVVHQNEIMSAHWAKNMVTVFTGVIHYKSKEGTLDVQSYGVISDDLNHDKSAVDIYKASMLEHFKTLVPFQVTKVHYWSDGAPSQFKNRYTLGNLCYHKEDHGCDADWSFFETSHGKGPVDGVGGRLKRGVWLKVMSGQEIVRNAEDFHRVALTFEDKIIPLLVESNLLEERRAILEKSRWVKMTTPIPATRSVHYVKLASGRHGVILTAAQSLFSVKSEEVDSLMTSHCIISGQSTKPLTTTEEFEPRNIKTVLKQKDYVLAEFSGKKNVKVFVSQVVSIDSLSNEVEVQCLRRLDEHGHHFSFPLTEDKSWIKMSDIKEILPIPDIDARDRRSFGKCINAQ